MDIKANNLDRLRRIINSQVNQKLRLFVIGITACQDSQICDFNPDGLERESLTVNLATTYCQANSPEEAQKWADEHCQKKLPASDGWTQYSYVVEEIPLAFLEDFLREKGYGIEPPPLD